MTIAQKLADVTASVRQPPQSGRNTYHNYDYSTRDDIFGVIRGELSSRGVAVLPSIEDVQRTNTGKTTKSGLPIVNTLVTVKILLVDAESGESLQQTWQGEAEGEDDKNVPKAVTQALRFWATNTFMLLDGSDEQMYGQPGTQSAPQRNVRRQESSEPVTVENQTARIVKVLNGAGFNDQQAEMYLDHIAKKEGAQDVSALPAARLKSWADGLQRRAAADQSAFVMGINKSLQALEGSAAA
jgi:hypothetical protein